jgi:hypothetical protein
LRYAHPIVISLSFDMQPQSANVCPLCGEHNQCAMELAKTTGEPVTECWCVSVAFSEKLLSKVPPEALNQVCICQKCASQADAL